MRIMVAIIHLAPARMLPMLHVELRHASIQDSWLRVL